MTKKEEVLKELGKIAEILNIKLDYIEEEKREYIICNNQKICTSFTSIYGIRQEFFGYVFLKEWRERNLGAFDRQTKNYIKMFWFDENFNQPFFKNN